MIFFVKRNKRIKDGRGKLLLHRGMAQARCQFDGSPHPNEATSGASLL